MSQGTDTKYFPQMQMVCHPATEWHTAHLWATHTLAPAQKHARLFQIRIKAGRLHELQGNQIRKNVSQIQMGCNSATTLARRCTPLSYGRAPKCQTNLASPLPSSRNQRYGRSGG